MLTFLDFLRFVAASEGVPPRTLTLEQEIGIGTGYHRKWYRSQKEHWLGWLAYQEAATSQKGRSVDPKKLWSQLKCSPMMFWLAEVASVEIKLLESAETAARLATAINPKDGNPHGKYMRRVLKWEVLAEAIVSSSARSTEDEARAQAKLAFDRLTERRPEFRRWRTT